MSAPQPLTILIAAMGGEGGGVLANWLVGAARREGLKVQSTSIPGVAQRTGATTYYIEMTRQKDDPAPIFCLSPMPGDVDIMVATEFLEAGRAISKGFVTPDRTLLVASTHRVFAIAERSAMGDGRFEIGKLFTAAKEQSQQAILFDMDAAAQEASSVLNAVLLGALAGSGRLPIAPDALEDGIRAEGKAVESNISGFRFGLAHARGEVTALATRSAPAARNGRAAPADLSAAVDRDILPAAREIAHEGVRRLVMYQGPDYAALYLDRLVASQAVEVEQNGDGKLTREVARQLAVRMSFEDIIRVAQVKASAHRFEDVAREVRAADAPFQIVDYFKPGIEEVCSLLPPRLARPMLAYSKRKGWLGTKYWGMHIRTTGLWGYLRVYGLSRLKGLRPYSLRYVEEQARIEAWLALVADCARRDLGLAREVCDCARLIKGYGDTFARGLANYDKIKVEVIAQALTANWPAPVVTEAVANARVAALADPEGERLDDTIASIYAQVTTKVAPKLVSVP
jgi:indolepyruvate ferredoxin oxidoreductase beta subunit